MVEFRLLVAAAAAVEQETVKTDFVDFLLEVPVVVEKLAFELDSLLVNLLDFLVLVVVFSKMNFINTHQFH